MALPDPTSLKTMDYAFLAQPFISVPAKAGISLKAMDYAFLAQPFVAEEETAGVTPTYSGRGIGRGLSRGIMR